MFISDPNAGDSTWETFLGHNYTLKDLEAYASHHNLFIFGPETFGKISGTKVQSPLCFTSLDGRFEEFYAHLGTDRQRGPVYQRRLNSAADIKPQRLWHQYNGCTCSQFWSNPGLEEIVDADFETQWDAKRKLWFLTPCAHCGEALLDSLFLQQSTREFADERLLTRAHEVVREVFGADKGAAKKELLDAHFAALETIWLRYYPPEAKDPGEALAHVRLDTPAFPWF